jgi:hypothetical protein
MPAQLSGLSYGTSLATPYCPPRPAPGEMWEETAFAHERAAKTFWAAAFSCPDGPEQDWHATRAATEERAAQRCRDSAARVRQAWRY